MGCLFSKVCKDKDSDGEYYGCHKKLQINPHIPKLDLSFVNEEDVSEDVLKIVEISDEFSDCGSSILSIPKATPEKSEMVSEEAKAIVTPALETLDTPSTVAQSGHTSRTTDTDSFAETPSLIVPIEIESNISIKSLDMADSDTINRPTATLMFYTECEAYSSPTEMPELTPNIGPSVPGVTTPDTRASMTNMQVGEQRVTRPRGMIQAGGRPTANRVRESGSRPERQKDGETKKSKIAVAREIRVMPAQGSESDDSDDVESVGSLWSISYLSVGSADSNHDRDLAVRSRLDVTVPSDRPTRSEHARGTIFKTSVTTGLGCSIDDDMTPVVDAVVRKRERPSAAKGPRPLQHHIPIDFLDLSSNNPNESSSEELILLDINASEDIGKKMAAEKESLDSWIKWRERMDKDNK